MFYNSHDIGNFYFGNDWKPGFKPGLHLIATIAQFGRKLTDSRLPENGLFTGLKVDYILRRP